MEGREIRARKHNNWEKRERGVHKMRGKDARDKTKGTKRDDG